ncbi:ATP-dependent helicase [bacterium]|nr:ATP-dependent helicase [bacterium]
MAWNDNLDGSAIAIASSLAHRLRVMAGPGTGKSFAMKRRVARLLEEAHVDPKRILAVTFTRVAADSLVSDLKELGIKNSDLIRAETLHSFCFSVLSQNEVLIRLGRKTRTLITYVDKKVLQFEAKPLLFDLSSNFGGQKEKSRKIGEFEAAWAKLQSDIPGWPVEPIDKQFQREFLDWHLFHYSMTIGEVVPQTLQYFRINPLVPELTMFDHVIVDEYQDLNRAEQELIDLLSSNASLLIVGDEDQSIYKFRYAHPEGIIEFSDRHEVEDHALVECRRCSKLNVRLANYFIQQNHPDNKNRLIEKHSNPNGEICIVQWNDRREQATHLAEYVSYLLQARNYEPGDILIISPRRRLGYEIRDEIKKRNIAVHSFYDEEPLKSLRAQESYSLLSLFININDRVSLRFLLGSESKDFFSNEYRTLRQYCVANQVDPSTVLNQLVNGTLQLPNMNNICNRYLRIINHLQELRDKDLSSIVDTLFPQNEDQNYQRRQNTFV